MSLEEPRDWCTEQTIKPIVMRLGNVYNLTSDCTPKNIRNILVQSALDIHSLSGDYTTLEDAELMIDECFDAYSNMITVIKSLLAIT